jgi:uncharacterized protein YdaU (DUF1376 family)
MMASLSYFPLYPKDFLGATGRLTAEKFGIYTRLLFASWFEPLKNDQKELQILTGSSKKKTSEILERFFVLKGDVWVNERLEKERVKAVKKHEVAVERARNAARARWESNDDATSNAPSNATSNAQAMPTHNPDSLPKGKRESSATLDIINNSGLIITNASVIHLIEDYHKSTNDDFLNALIDTLKTKTPQQANRYNYVKAILTDPPVPKKEPKQLKTADLYTRLT